MHTHYEEINKNVMLLNDYLNVFEPILNVLGSEKENNNIVLCGTQILKLHGLRMNRAANDLDIVIFQPTNEQLSKLAEFSFFQIDNHKFAHYNEDDKKSIIINQKQNSIKFKKKELYIDILLSQDELPPCLMLFKHKYTYYKCQNILLNIRAKNSYTQGSEGMIYRREKDMKDLIDLKNSNFNF